MTLRSDSFPEGYARGTARIKARDIFLGYCLPDPEAPERKYIILANQPCSRRSACLEVSKRVGSSAVSAPSMNLKITFLATYSATGKSPYL